MALIKVIELLAESEKSWEDAIHNAVLEASETIRNIRSVNVENFSVQVDNDQIVHWRINCKISFVIE